MSRVYVGNLDPRVMERDLEDEFRIFGVLRRFTVKLLRFSVESLEAIADGMNSVHGVARRPPGYAFIEFDDRRSAMDAIRELDGKNGWHVELSHNSKGGGGRGGRRGGGEDLKCYECGEPGHFARECRSRIGSWGAGNGQRRSPSPHRRKSPSYGYGRRIIMSCCKSYSPHGRRSPQRRSISPCRVAATAGHLHIVILVVIHLMLMELKAGPELSKSGMISMETICNIVAPVGSVRKRDLCYLCSFRDNEVVRTCGFAWLPLCKGFQPLKLVPCTPFCDACCQQHIKLGIKQHAFATSLHLSAHGFLTIASLHHLFYLSPLLHVYYLLMMDRMFIHISGVDGMEPFMPAFCPHAAFSMEVATTFTNIFDDHLSDGLSAKPQRFGEKLNWKPKLMKKRVLFYVMSLSFRLYCISCHHS
ncbi:hypothetical protein CXB51_001515 [Gossypium anomalum]|uniref:Uncharacterized protein n=1 Tax=Gossypium anomalum TaxID=47600 RepID=A0A8J5Z5W9_9ROSI|nr:hypothetical protein CXB51_001515 [Gossypium anomalum]